jgi:hypothetical protein
LIDEEGRIVNFEFERKITPNFVSCFYDERSIGVEHKIALYYL